VIKVRGQILNIVIIHIKLKSGQDLCPVKIFTGHGHVSIRARLVSSENFHWTQAEPNHIYPMSRNIIIDVLKYYN